jgi:hypothetical protein
MANAMFPKGAQGLIDGSIDMDTDDIRVILLGTGYTYDSADQFVSDLTPGSNEISRSAAGLAGKSVTDGVFDATDLVFTALSGSQVKSLVVFKHTGSDATARVILYLDTGTGLPFTPNGADFTIAWDNGTNKIFKIG